MKTHSRRSVLLGGSPSKASAVRDGTSVAPAPPITPRSAWGHDLVPTGPLTEVVDGVRFVLIHHTETPNGYGADDVPRRLRSIFAYHTGTKGWSDIAYNFFVDAYGVIWEGRSGSVERPIQGDATGGSQGHALLCCFLGTHVMEPPTPAAVEAMATLTAWLADRYRIDLCAGPTIRFVSQGSNRWPAGTTVTTDPLAGHRDMSMTACPGDAAYTLIRGPILARAQELSSSCRSSEPSASETDSPTTSTESTTAPKRAPAMARTPEDKLGSTPISARGAGLIALPVSVASILAAVIWRRRTIGGEYDPSADDPELRGVSTGEELGD